MSTVISILIGVAIGVGISVQSTFNASLAKAVGLWPTTLIVHLLGTITLMLPLWFFRHQAQWSGWNQVPWYAYLGGVFGAFIISGIAYLLGRMEVAAGISIILAAQMITALLIDHFGLFGVSQQSVDWIKIVGVLLLMAGVRLILR